MALGPCVYSKARERDWNYPQGEVYERRHWAIWIPRFWCFPGAANRAGLSSSDAIQVDDALLQSGCNLSLPETLDELCTS